MTSRQLRFSRLLLPAAALLLVASASRGGAALALAPADPDAPPAPRREPARPADWSRAPLLPAALGAAGEMARRESAAAAPELRAGPDGSVDLPLSTVLDRTLAHNLDLLVASYQPALSAEQLNARRALYDPLLTFLVSLASSKSPATSSLAGASVLSSDSAAWDAAIREATPLGGSLSLAFSNRRQTSNSVFASPNPAYDSSLRLELVQPLLRSFGRAATEREIRIARNDRASAREGFRDAVMAKVTEAIRAYWNLHGAIENLRVQGEALRLAQELLQINRTRVEVGTMAPLDISAAEAEVKRNEEQVLAAEEGVKTAEDVLRQLMNVETGSPLWRASLRPTDGPAYEARPIDVDLAIATALARRVDLRRQTLALANADIRLDYARNQLRPGLNLRASYAVAGVGGTEILREGGPFGSGPITRIPGGYGDALDQLTGLDFDSWTLEATLDYPLFNQAARAAHAAAVLDRGAARDRLALLEQAVAVEVRRQARSVETSLKRIEAARATHKLQQERLNAERKKFEHGLSTNFEVQQAQKDLTAARVSEIQAQLDYLKAVADLERAMGTVLDTHRIRISE